MSVDQAIRGTPPSLWGACCSRSCAEMVVQGNQGPLEQMGTGESPPLRHEPKMDADSGSDVLRGLG